MDVQFWRSPATIRTRCGWVGQQALQGVCPEWHLDLDRIPEVVIAVLRVMKRDYPDGDIPFHSRWRHLPDAAVHTGDPKEDLRLKVEGVVVSVLLDAGAGSQWRWRDPQGQVWQRSEGLARASWQAFVTGAFAGAYPPEWLGSVPGDFLAGANGLGPWSQWSGGSPPLALLGDGKWTSARRLGVFGLGDGLSVLSGWGGGIPGDGGFGVSAPWLLGLLESLPGLPPLC